MRQNMGITSLWEDVEAKLLTPGQLLGYPRKVWGITVQTSYWEGQWHQNCGYTSPIHKEINEKQNFFVNRSVPEKFQQENFSGQVPPESLRTQDSENVYESGVQQIFYPVSKKQQLKCGVKKNRYGHYFQNFPVENFRVRSDLQKSSIFH